MLLEGGESEGAVTDVWVWNWEAGEERLKTGKHSSWEVSVL